MSSSSSFGFVEGTSLTGGLGGSDFYWNKTIRFYFFLMASLTFSFLSSEADDVAFVSTRALVGVGGVIEVAGGSAGLGCLLCVGVEGNDDKEDGVCRVVGEEFVVVSRLTPPPLIDSSGGTTPPRDTWPDEGISRKAGSCASGKQAAITFPIF